MRQYLGYTVYEDGKVVGPKGTTLKPWNNGYGYLYVEIAGKKTVLNVIHNKFYLATQAQALPM